MSFRFASARGVCRGGLFLAPLLFALPVRAQQVVLDRYHVNAPPPTGGVPAGVSHVELNTLLPVDVGSLLARELSPVTAIRRGGVASDVLLRGLGRDNVTVLLDGAPAHAACPGRMDPPVFHVSTPLVEHIAVQAGPFDVRHGGAPGGSIAVESAEPPRRRASTLSLLAGADALRAIDVVAGAPLAAGWRGLAGASYQEGDSYREGNGVRITRLPALNYRPDAADGRAFAIGHAEAHAAWESAAGGSLTLRAAGNDARDVLYPALMMDARSDRATRLAAAWSAPLTGGPSDRWRISAHHHRMEHDMSDALRTSSLGMWSARGYMMRTVAATTSGGVSAEMEISRPLFDLVHGGQWVQRNWVADNVIGANANAMLPDVTMRQAGYFVQAESRRVPWKAKFGARVDAWRTKAARDVSFAQRAHGTTANERNDVAPSGFALVERTWSDAFAVFAGVGHGARAPDPQERYIVVDRPGVGTDWCGNPELEITTATELNVGGRLRVGRGSVVARAFSSRFNHFILLRQLTPAAGSTANAARTESYLATDAELTGADVRAEWTIGRAWRVSAGAAGQRGRKRGGGVADADLPEIPPWRGQVVARWAPRASSLEAEWQWAARQSHVDRTAGERMLPGHGVVHLRAVHRFTEHVALSAGVDNLFDRAYATHNAYTRDPFAAGVVIDEPGRSVYVQMRWTL